MKKWIALLLVLMVVPFTFAMTEKYEKAPIDDDGCSGVPDITPEEPVVNDPEDYRPHSRSKKICDSNVRDCTKDVDMRWQKVKVNDDIVKFRGHWRGTQYRDNNYYILEFFEEDGIRTLHISKDSMTFGKFTGTINGEYFTMKDGRITF